MINTSMKKLTEKSSICKVDDFFRAARGAVERTEFDVFSVWLYRGCNLNCVKACS